jgi:colanic acid/amylovoran biosynthesis protein
VALCEAQKVIETTKKGKLALIIEIRRVGFVNKGAELMLYSALHKMREHYPEARFAVAAREYGSYEKRAKLGLLQKPWLWYHFQWGNLAELVPGKIRNLFGVVLDREIDVVLDSAGFAYSDQLSLRNSQELADSCKRWKKNRAKIILLPQAFGPFTSNKSKSAIKVVADHADLIYARETVSYQHLIGVTGPRPNIKISPDFTTLIGGVLPDDFDTENNRFCLVTNYRMVDKTNAVQSKAYLPFMINCAKYLLDQNQKPFILIHEGVNDLMLAEQINEAVGGKIPIIQESDPLKIKGIIGACEGTIGSRFHGLVSALSQGVPSLATGWSHKYQMLFDDYGFSKGLLDVSMSIAALQQRIDMIIDPQAKMELQKTFLDHSLELKAASKAMWEDVCGVIGG